MALIAATSIALGMIVVQLRSAAAYALISIFILAAFAAAALTSGGETRWLLLFLSVLFFNLGMAAEVGLLTLLEAARRGVRD